MELVVASLKRLETYTPSEKELEVCGSYSCERQDYGFCYTTPCTLANE
jgi:hypothetical protein